MLRKLGKKGGEWGMVSGDSGKKGCSRKAFNSSSYGLIVVRSE